MVLSSEGLSDMLARLARAEREIERLRNIELPFSAGNDAYCYIRSSSDQAIANTTVTALTFGSEVEDLLGMHSTSVNTSRITIPTGYGGMWMLTVVAIWAGGGTGSRQFGFMTNGAIQAGRSIPALANGHRSALTLGPFRLAAGDYVEAYGYQDSGGSVNVIGSSSGVPTDFIAARVR